MISIRYPKLGYFVIFAMLLSSCSNLSYKYSEDTNKAIESTLQSSIDTDNQSVGEDKPLTKEDSSSVEEINPLFKDTYYLVSSQSIAADDIKNIHTPYIKLSSNGLMSGYSACNRVIGKINIKDIQNNNIQFVSLGGTRMMCDHQANSIESNFFKDLQLVESFKLEDNYLYLSNKYGQTIVTLRKK